MLALSDLKEWEGPKMLAQGPRDPHSNLCRARIRPSAGLAWPPKTYSIIESIRIGPLRKHLWNHGNHAGIPSFQLLVLILQCVHAARLLNP